MMASPLANVLKKSLTINSQKLYEAWDWNEAAKELQKKYAKLVKLHDSIKLKEDWQDLAERHRLLTAEMAKLEKATIGTSDEERNKYIARVKKLIAEAKLLEQAVEAEPQRREDAAQLVKNYKERAQKLDGLLKYTALHQLEKTQPFSELKQLKLWSDNANPLPSTNQMTRIVSTVDDAEKAVRERNAARELEAKRLEAEQKETDEKEKKQKAEQEAKANKAKENEAALRKSEQDDLNRKQQLHPLMDEAIKAVVHESAGYAAVNKEIAEMEKRLTDKKHSAFADRLEEIKKQIRDQLRKALLNKEYASFGAESGFDGLEAALRTVRGQKGGLDAKDAITMQKDLDKVLAKMSDLEGDRTDYEDSLKSCDPLLVEKRTRNPKVRAYVYRPELGAAKKQLKDMVGILGKERRGRTSPNGNANHVHILGDATFNAVFDWNGPGEAVRLLGFVMGHMDKQASSSVLSEAANVEARANGTDFVEVEVDVVAKTIVEV